MAKQRSSGILNRLAGKRVVFNGKFDYGVEDSLKAMTRAQQGKVADDLDAKVDYLVLADLAASKTAQKQALALNGKGASIQVIDDDAFRKLAAPTDQEVLALMRAGESKTLEDIFGTTSYYFNPQRTSPQHTFVSEKLDGIKLGEARLDLLAFKSCSFVGAELKYARFALASDCDFTRLRGDDLTFYDARGSRFREARLKDAGFEGDFSGADFTAANLDDVRFVQHGYGRRKPTQLENVVFSRATLKDAHFHDLSLKSADFDGADLTAATFNGCTLASATFRGAVLRNATFVGAKLAGADFTNADLSGANLVDADLTDAVLAGADLKGTNLRGAKLSGVDLSKAKNYDPNAAATGSAGPALKELDQINKKAKRLQFSFRVRKAGSTGDDNEVGIDSSGLQYGWGLRLPAELGGSYGYRNTRATSMSAAMLQLASLLGNRQVRFETVEVSSTKSPKGGRELKELVIEAITEAFAQQPPAEEELAKATKAYRDAENQKGAAERKKREAAKAREEKKKEEAKKQIAKKIEKAVGKVTDTASFLKALEVRIEKPKIEKATKMLKASGFKLFNDVTDQHVSGVVKSQTDPDLVYACRLADDGHYACCTQNLNICGGLRGSACKHLLVLIIGLVQAGELDPTTVDGWLAKSHDAKPELDKEVMGAIFLKYKGAEAGEVDWRPTETVPEDYYSL